MARVTFFEVPADSPDRAIKFYKDVFGWQFEKWDGPMEYWLVKTGKDGERGIDGGMMKKSDNLPAMRNVIDVSSVDEYSAKVTSSGGRVLMPKTEIPGIGFFTLFQDTEGNVLGMMQETRKNN